MICGNEIVEMLTMEEMNEIGTLPNNIKQLWKHSELSVLFL